MSTRINGTYFIADGCLCKDTKEGPIQLTNFTASILRELVYHDASKTTTHLVVVGELDDGTVLPEVTIDATEFAGLGWVPQKWGMAPIVYPQPSAERDIKTAIQIASKPERQHIYTHTGWTTINEKPTFLSVSGGINADGFDPSISVQLPQELSRYSLPAPCGGCEALAASLRLINLGPKNITWPLTLATYRAAIGPADFAIHLAGRTGTFKSEVSSLFQSHYGTEMDSRHLPASWSSTANALECLAYKSKNAIITVDDFVPVGTSWMVRTLQSKADQFIRGQGNQAGRARLTETTSMQQTFYPRGIILSTGEDIPEGHSVRARMLILELSPGDIESAKLTAAQAQRPAFAQAMSNWIHWLSKGNWRPLLEERAKFYRDQNLGMGHSRTPAIIGELIATAELISIYCEQQGFFTQETRDGFTNKARTAIIDSGMRQGEYLHSADPVTALCECIRQLLGSGQAHLRTRNGGIPEDAQQYGWTSLAGLGEMPTFKAGGPRLGWLDTQAGEILLDPNTLPLLKKHSGGKLATTQQTLLKRLKEAGILTRQDAARERNTVRMTLEGHPHSVLALSLESVMGE